MAPCPIVCHLQEWNGSRAEAEIREAAPEVSTDVWTKPNWAESNLVQTKLKLMKHCAQIAFCTVGRHLETDATRFRGTFKVVSSSNLFN